MAGKGAGEYAYLLSLVVAVLAGIAAAAGFGASGWVALLLVVLGVIVGFLNITEKETNAFLIATVALIVASLGASVTGDSGVFSALNVIPGLGRLINAVVANIAIFAAPAAIVIAAKAIYNLARSK